MSSRLAAYRPVRWALALALLAGFVSIPMGGQAVAATPAGTAAADAINGVVFHDTDADGVNDTAEPGLSGVTVQLFNGATQVASTTTSAAGVYSFSGLTVGTPYRIVIPTAPSNTFFTPSGTDQDFVPTATQTSASVAAATPGNTYDAALRPRWVVTLGDWGNAGGVISGQAPFATYSTSTCPAGYAPGDDCSADDAIVRVNDVATFNFAVSASDVLGGATPPPLSNVTLVQQVVPAAGANIAPGTLPTACLTTAGNPVSSFTKNADGSLTLVCNLGTYTTTGTSRLLSVNVRVLSSVNGSTFTSTAYATATTAALATSPGTKIPDSTTTQNAVESGILTDTLTISADFNFDLKKAQATNPTPVWLDINGDGVKERGTQIDWLIGLSSPNKANEPFVNNTFTFTDDFFFSNSSTNYTSPWHDVEHYIINCAPGWYASAGFWTMPAGVNGPTAAVLNPGTCAAARTGGTTSPYTITVKGFDESPVSFPTTVPGGGIDLTNGPYYYTVIQISTWFPDTALESFDGITGNGAANGTIWNRVAGFDPTSASGQSNYDAGVEPGWCDPAYDPYTNPLTTGCTLMPNGTASNNVAKVPFTFSPPGWSASGGFAKYYYQPANTTWSGGTVGRDLLPQETWANFPQSLGLRQPGQLILNDIMLNAGGEVPNDNIAMCDVFDNTTHTLVPATQQYPTAPAGTYAWLRYGPTDANDAMFVYEFGHFDLGTDDPLYQASLVGTAGIVDSTYPATDTYNTADGRYWGNWATQRTVTNACRTTAPKDGWFTDPTAVPGGLSAVNAVRIRQKDPLAKSGFTGTASYANYDWNFLLQARDTFNGGPHDGQVIPTGTVLANFIIGTVRRSDWTPSSPASYTPVWDTSYSPAPLGGVYGDRATLARGDLNVKKNTVTINGIGDGAAAVDTTGTATAGNPVVWKVHPSGSAVAPGTSQGIVLTDVLPVGTVYDAACTQAVSGGVMPTLVEPNTPAAGQTRITWNLGDLPYNTVWPDRYVCTQTDQAAAQGTNLVNTVTIDSATDWPASDTHTVTLNQLAQVSLGKYVDNSLDPLNDAQQYTLRARNSANTIPMKNFTILEVFPFVGDHSNAGSTVIERTPGSSFSGSLTLTAVPKVFFSDDPAKPAMSGTFFYTADAPSTIDQDLNTNASTWCSYDGTAFTLVSGTGTCPTTLASVTAFKFVASEDLQGTGMANNLKDAMDITFTLKSASDKAGDLFQDKFTAVTPTIREGQTGTRLQLLQSNQVEVTTFAMAVGDLVFIDRNNDGRYTAGTDSLAPDGTVVQLWSPGADGVVGGGDDTMLFTTTTKNGTYLFAAVPPGKVFVVIPATEFAAGGHLTGWTAEPASLVGGIDENDNVSQDGTAGTGSFAGAVVSTVHELSYTMSGTGVVGNEPLGDNTHGLVLPSYLTDGFSNLTIDLGVTGLGSLGDTVWFDSNGNGTQDAGEVGIPGVTVTLVWLGPDGVAGGGDDVTSTTTTDSNGKYLFEHLPAGAFTVTTSGTPISSLNQTYDLNGTSTANTTTVSLAAAETRLDVDFGYNVTLALGDLVFLDVNRDGVYNAGDTPISGAVVTLHAADGTVIGSPVTTGADGLYSFTGLQPGDYDVSVTVPAGYYVTSPVVDDPNNNVNNDSNVYLDGAGTFRTSTITLSATYDAATGTVVGAETSNNGLTNNTLDLGFQKPGSPGITLIKKINGDDANTAPGVAVPAGSTMSITFEVTNSGDVRLNPVTVTDDIVSDIVCPKTALDPSESMTCTASLAAPEVGGRHTNMATVTGTPVTGADTPLLDANGLPVGTVSATNPATAHVPATASISIVKSINGDDADTAPGVLVPAGSMMSVTFVVTNTGTSYLGNVTVLDSAPTDVSCPKTVLAPRESMTCTASIPAPEAGGKHYDDAWVNGTPTLSDGQTPAVGADGWPLLPVSDHNPANAYVAGTASVSIVKSINGDDANIAPGVAVPGGWGGSPAPLMRVTFFVTNTGTTYLSNVLVSDSYVVAPVCGSHVLAPGSTMSCQAEIPAPAPGTVHYDLATVIGTPTLSDGTPALDANANPLPNVTDDDPAYAYVPIQGAATLVKSINGADANDSPGVEVPAGSTMAITFDIRNSGNVRLGQFQLFDSHIGVVSCPKDTLEPGESMTCTGTLPAPEPGSKHSNIASLTAVPIVDPRIPSWPVYLTDPAHAYTVAAPSISIVKSINGDDANTAPGVSVPAGSAMAVTFLVTNTGNTYLANVTVTDTDTQAITCPQAVLAPQGTMTCTATITAPAAGGTHQDLATVVGTPTLSDGRSPARTLDGTPLANVTDDDPAHAYAPGAASITIVKSINGDDADTAPGVSVAAGSAMAVMFLVTNTGNTYLAGVTVTDTDTQAITCPQTVLAPQGTMTCTATITAPAAGGTHQDLGSVVGTPTLADGATPALGQDGKPLGSVTDDNPANAYAPGAASITIVKSINGADANTAPGVPVTAGSAMTVTFLVTNTGNTYLSNVTVTDTDTATISCPATVLAPQGTMTCTATITAPAAGGTHQDLGTAVATPTLADGTTPAVGADGTTPLANVTDDDPAHAFAPGTASIAIVKKINGDDADTAPGVAVEAGSAMAVTFLVTNLGTTYLANVTVTDTDTQAISCPKTVLAPSESMTCTATITAPAAGGTHQDLGSVVGTPTLADGTTPAVGADGTTPLANVNDDDPAHAFAPGTASIVVVKKINGDDADTAPGVSVAAGSAMAVTFTVTNTGTLHLANVTVTDTDTKAITCPKTALAPSESMTCTATITAPAAGGTHQDLGTAVATPTLADGTTPALGQDGKPLGTVTDDNPANAYAPGAAGVVIVKKINGDDANTAPGVQVAAGSAMAVTFEVTNTGVTTLTGVKVSDTDATAVTCPTTVLAPGESMTCTATITAPAAGGTHVDTGSVTGTPTNPDGTPAVDAQGKPLGPVADTDDAHAWVPAPPAEPLANTGSDVDTGWLVGASALVLAGIGLVGFGRRREQSLPRRKG